MALTRVKPEDCASLLLFEQVAGRALPERDQVIARVEHIDVAAGEVVFHQDDPHPYVYVIREGLLKFTYLNAEGEEWIKSLVADGQFFGSLSALVAGRASFSVIAIEPCRLERLPFSLLDELADRDLSWSRMLRNALIHLAERKERRERQFLTMTAEERYRLLLREEAHLLRRTPQKDLAAYLGITPVGLSRIARRVREEQAKLRA
ncbi:Crp/Fnr family transcriptional regulator [Peteryoungia desertarenae]|uniref:Crp/Fnr family transcriptional regulator n=1 Tax=Peteryoungia desertarenae TaxID=1813451 RepID=A0ABX6QMP6_9HYPH|nr:Crp/Fnr family transcriptional regulator [Peteryoungia desertarenae]QLF69759.1 Crp/Fnr family transcriptional regulator [Peteryoungia desertarenae]